MVSDPCLVPESSIFAALFPSPMTRSLTLGVSEEWPKGPWFEKEHRSEATGDRNSGPDPQLWYSEYSKTWSPCANVNIYP